MSINQFLIIRPSINPGVSAPVPYTDHSVLLLSHGPNPVHFVAVELQDNFSYSEFVPGDSLAYLSPGVFRVIDNKLNYLSNLYGTLTREQISTDGTLVDSTSFDINSAPQQYVVRRLQYWHNDSILAISLGILDENQWDFTWANNDLQSLNHLNIPAPTETINGGSTEVDYKFTPADIAVIQDRIFIAASALYFDDSQQEQRINKLFIYDFNFNLLCSTYMEDPNNSPDYNPSLYAFGKHVFDSHTEGNIVTGEDFFTEVLSCEGIVTGISETPFVNATIWPNPVNEKLNIRLEQEGNAFIAISDLSGKVIRSMESTGQLTTIELNDLKAGVYFVSVEQNGQSIVQKIVKQ